MVSKFRLGNLLSRSLQLPLQMIRRRFIAVTALLLAVGTLAATPGASQTVQFRYAQTALGSGWLNPAAVVADSSGNVYVADTGNHAVKQIAAFHGAFPTPAVIRTLASGIASPSALALDGNGNLYVADSGSGAIQEIVASSPGVFSATPTVVTLAIGLTAPSGIAVDAQGNVFFSQAVSGANALEEIAATAVGVFPATPSITAIATSAPWNKPMGLALDAAGNLYVAGNLSHAVSEVLQAGGYTTVNTLASNFTPPIGVAVDAQGDVFVADATAASITELQAVNGTFQATATWNNGWTAPTGVFADGLGNVFVADARTSLGIQEVMTTQASLGAVALSKTSSPVTLVFSFTGNTTISSTAVLTQGTAGLDFADAQTGSCSASSFSANTTCTMIASFTPTQPGLQMGAVQLLDGSGNPLAQALVTGVGIGPAASFSPGTVAMVTASGLGATGLSNANSPVFDAQGNLYLADAGNGRVVLLTSPSSGVAAATVAAAGLPNASGLARDGAGNLYVVANGNTVVEVTPQGNFAQLDSNGLSLLPTSLTVDGAGNVYAADGTNNQIVLFPAGGSAKVLFSGSPLNQPMSAAVDTAGNVYVANFGDNNIVAISKNGTPSILSTSYSTSSGSVSYSNPSAIAIDPAGDLFICDMGNDRVVMIPAGSSQAQALSTGTVALGLPYGIAVSRSGDLAIINYADGSIVLDRQQIAPTLNFASTAIDATSSVQAVTLFDLGNAPLSFPVQGAGNNPSLSNGFTLQSTTCPSVSAGGSAKSMAASSACSFNLSFQPGSIGTLSGSLVLTDNSASGTTQTISLNGTATAPTIVISPAAGTLTDAVAGSAYRQQFTASSGLAPYTYALALTSGTLPAGLSFNPATGLLSGTPTATGTVNFTITATDSTPAANGGPYTSAAQAYTLNVPNTAILVAPTSLPGGTAGSAYNAQGFTANGGVTPYTFAVTSGALPAGLQLVNGVLSGTPTATGTFTFSVTATDSASQTGNRSYSITLAAPRLSLAPARTALTAATAEIAYTQTFTLSGGTSPSTFTVASGALPAGLTLSAAGVLSGIPTSAGNFNFTVQAADSTTGTGAPFSLTKAYSLTLYAPTVSVIPMNGRLSAGTVGETNYQLAFSGTGGAAPYSFAVTGGALPSGMSLTNGVLAGIPTASGNATFTITATDSNGFTGVKGYTLPIGSPTITLTPANGALGEGVAEAVYSPVTFGATSSNGGTAPYTFALSAGTLPSGMTLSPAGVLSGTPMTTGLFLFTVMATDANHQTGSAPYALTIAPPLISITTPMLLDAAVSIPYNQRITAIGGSGNYTFAVTAGSLPAWLRLESNGLLHGVPSIGDVGGMDFTVTATDSDGYSGSLSFAPSVYPVAAYASGSLDLGLVTLGKTAATGTVSFTFNGNFALGSSPALVATQGAAGLDFSNAGTGTCVTGIYGQGNVSCTVDVSFAPLLPGQRLGAVELLDPNGNILATAFLHGGGKGPAANFAPGLESSVASSIAVQNPQGIAVDASGNVFVADSGLNQVLKIDNTGQATAILTASAGLGIPRSVAVDGAGNVFVADSGNNTIWMLAPPYASAIVVTSATVNAASGGLSAPSAVAVDGRGCVYIADTGNSRVLKTCPSWDSGFYTPWALATYYALQSPAALAVDRKGYVYIADSTLNLVQIEPPDEWGDRYPETRLTAGLHQPAGVAVDVNGNVLVANAGASNLLKFVKLPDGSFSLPSSIATIATLTVPSAIALDGRGNVYLADSHNSLLLEENYAAAPMALSFVTPTSQGSRDLTDGALSFTVTNAGNADLNFGPETGIVDTTGSFTYSAARDCLIESQSLTNSTLRPNASCIFAIAFTPQMEGAIASSLDLTYSNLGSANATSSIFLTGTGVAAFAFTPASGSLPNGTVDAAYSQTIAVTSGGTAPYTYAVTLGALPPGVALSAAGILSGSPASAGVFPFTITATDSTGSTGNASYLLTIVSDAGSTVSIDSATQQTLTFTFSATTNLVNVAVLTQGIAGMDFTDSGKGTCTAKTYNSGDTCTVVVAFQAMAPGTRYGAVQLLDSSKHIAAQQLISAVGTAPLALFSPGAVSSVAFKDLSALTNPQALNGPSGMVVDPAGNLYIADIFNNRVVKATAAGAISTVATPGIVLHYPTGVALDGAGNLYIADNADGTVVEVTPAGSAQILDNGSLTLTNNFSVAVDSKGNVYTTDLGTPSSSTNAPGGTARIVEYPTGGTAQALAITGVTLASPFGLAVDGSGNLYVGDGSSIVKVASGGAATALTAGSQGSTLTGPLMLAADGVGNLYVADTGNNQVLLLPASATSLTSAIPLNTNPASLHTPMGIAIAGPGDLYISDFLNNSVVASAQETSSTGPVLGFDSLAGVASAENSVTVINAGNSALTIPAPTSGVNPAFGASPSLFALATDSTCPQVQSGAANGSLAVGATCLYAFNFTPSATGSQNISDVLTLTDDSNNVTGAKQTVLLEGDTLVVSPGKGTPSTPYALPDGTVGVNYNPNLAVTFTAAGGAAPYYFSIVSGSLPNGMEMSDRGVLWGTPTTVCVTQFTVQATDVYGQQGTQIYTLTIDPAAITLNPANPVLPSGLALSAYSLRFTANGGTNPYSFAITSGTLPQGLALSRGGELTGRANAALANNSFTVTATDAHGQTGSQSYTLTIQPAPLVVTPAQGNPTTLAGATALMLYEQNFAVTGGTPPYTWSVSSGLLPAGLTLDPATGILYGQPATVGTAAFTITATDSTPGGSFSGSQSYSLTVTAPVITVAPTTLPSGAVGLAYTQELSGHGGSGPYTYAVTGGTLPAGLALTAGNLAGTPAMGGVSTGFTITATDSGTGASGAQSYAPTIYIAPATAPAVTISPAQSVGTSTLVPATMTFTFHGAAIVGGVAVLTVGAPNLDFSNARTGSCTITEYNEGDTCTVDVLFNPFYPGARTGAVELLDASGNILGTGLITGTGTGPVANILPAVESSVASSGVALQNPQGLAADSSGNLYVADGPSHAVLLVNPNGKATKLIDLTAGAGNPIAVAVDGSGSIYVADSAQNTLWKQSPPFTGTPLAIVSASVNSPGSGLSSIGGVAIDGAGNLYFSDPTSGKVYAAAPALATATGFATPVQVSTLSTLATPRGLAIDNNGHLFIADSGNNRVLVEPLNGSTAANQESVIGSSATLNAPSQIAADSNGNVYIVSANRALKAVRNASGYAAPGVIATKAFPSLAGIALDPSGNLFLSDATTKALVEENYASGSKIKFATATLKGSMDTTDGTADITVLNFGNAPLTAVNPGLSLPEDFKQMPGSGTPADCTTGFALAANATCNLSFEFAPVNTGSLSEAVWVIDNSLNTMPSAAQAITLQGEGLIPLVVTWATPAAIPYGTALSATQLNASSGLVPGTFVYTPAAGTILQAGTQTLSATFTPTDTVDYKSVTVTVQMVVNLATSNVLLTSSANPTLALEAVTFTAKVTSATGVPTGTVNFLDDGTILGSATLTAGMATFTTSTNSATALPAGTQNMTAIYVGDSNFTSSTSPAVPQTVIDFTLNSGGNNNSNATVPNVGPGGTAAYTLAIAPSAGISLPGPTTLTIAGLPSWMTVTLNATGWTQASSTSWTLPANTPITSIALNVQVPTTISEKHPANAPWSPLAPFALALLILPVARRLRRTGLRLGRAMVLLVLLVGSAAALSGLSACIAPDLTVTPRTYEITVTVSSGPLSHSTNLYLHLQ